MLETELKKLTAALEANTAALTGGASAPSKTVAAPAPTPATPAPAIAQAPPVQAAATAPPVVPAQVAPVAQQIAPAVVPAAIPQASAIDHKQAQAELGAIVQALGPNDTRVQATMLQYGSARLNEIPAENLFALVQACKALLTA